MIALIVSMGIFTQAADDLSWMTPLQREQRRELQGILDRGAWNMPTKFCPLNEKYNISTKPNGSEWFLGKGAYGMTYRATHVTDLDDTGMPLQVAIKVVDQYERPDGKTVTSDDRKSIKKEINVLTQLGKPGHPNVAKMYEVIESIERHPSCSSEPRYKFIVQEFCNGGELFDHVINNGKIPEAEARGLMLQMVNGMEYIHRHGFTHRDLKLENVLLHRADGKLWMKIIDLGFADSLTYRRSNSGNQVEPLDVSCGTLAYAAPNVLNRSYDGRKADVWSLGCVLYIMLSGGMPFDGSEANQMSKIRSGNFNKKPHRWGQVTENGKNLLRGMLNTNQAARFTWDQVKNSAWLCGEVDKMAREHSETRARLEAEALALEAQVAQLTLPSTDEGVLIDWSSADYNQEWRFDAPSLMECAERSDVALLEVLWKSREARRLANRASIGDQHQLALKRVLTPGGFPSCRDPETTEKLAKLRTPKAEEAPFSDTAVSNPFCMEPLPAQPATRAQETHVPAGGCASWRNACTIC